ncbi:MAG: helix-turn-helix transcriptional regulator [Microthrixaceae bacterium]
MPAGPTVTPSGPRSATPPGDPRWRRADALADPTRFAAYQHLLDADAPRSVAEITDAVGVHHTAVRAHLVKLRDAGLVTETRAEPNGRGRPRLLYAATADPAPPETSTDSARDPYRELSAMLATVVRDASTPRLVGAAVGRDAALRRDPDAEIDTVDLIEQEGRDLGFDPVRRGRPDRPELVLRHCPFADVATDDPESICSLHLGVAEGIAARHGDVEVVELVRRDPHRAGCRLRLRRVDAAPSQGARP